MHAHTHTHVCLIMYVHSYTATSVSIVVGILIFNSFFSVTSSFSSCYLHLYRLQKPLIFCSRNSLSKPIFPQSQSSNNKMNLSRETRISSLNATYFNIQPFFFFFLWILSKSHDDRLNCFHIHSYVFILFFLNFIILLKCQVFSYYFA